MYRPRPDIACCWASLAWRRCLSSRCGSAKVRARRLRYWCCARRSPATPAWRRSPRQRCPTNRRSAEVRMRSRRLRLRNRVKESAGDAAAPCSGFAQRASLTIRKIGQRVVASARDQRRIVKLVTAQRRRCRSERAVAKEPRLAITEVQFALGEARRVAEQPRHRMAGAVGILEPLSEHHVAAALAVDGTRHRKLRKPGAKALRGRERAGVKLRIAAREPATVAAPRRRLVGKRGERKNLGAGSPPAVEDVGVDERESC